MTVQRVPGGRCRTYVPEERGEVGGPLRVNADALRPVPVVAGAVRAQAAGADAPPDSVLPRPGSAVLPDRTPTTEAVPGPQVRPGGHDFPPAVAAAPPPGEVTAGPLVRRPQHDQFPAPLPGHLDELSFAGNLLPQASTALDAAGAEVVRLHSLHGPAVAAAFPHRPAGAGCGR